MRAKCLFAPLWWTNWNIWLVAPLLGFVPVWINYSKSFIICKGKSETTRQKRTGMYFIFLKYLNLFIVQDTVVKFSSRNILVYVQGMIFFRLWRHNIDLFLLDFFKSCIGFFWHCVCMSGQNKTQWMPRYEWVVGLDAVFHTPPKESTDAHCSIPATGTKKTPSNIRVTSDPFQPKKESLSASTQIVSRLPRKQKESEGHHTPRQTLQPWAAHNVPGLSSERSSFRRKAGVQIRRRLTLNRPFFLPWEVGGKWG